MGNFFKTLRYRLEWFGLALLAWLIPLLPRRGAHWLGQGLGAVAYLADYRGRGTAVENLRAVYGEYRPAVLV